jgi:hypothetical protein
MADDRSNPNEPGQQPSQPTPQQEPPRPHGDKLDDEIGHERTGDLNLPATNEEGIDSDEQD